jgi:hypothetical protein
MRALRRSVVLPCSLLLALVAGVAGASTASAGIPEITVDGVPLSGATVGPRFTAAVPAAGGSVKAKFLLDGAYLGADTTAPLEYPLVTGAGPHRLTVRLYDATGNQTRLEAAFSVSSSTSPPWPSATTTPPVPTPTPTATGQSGTTPTAARTVSVSTGAELSAALAAATPGTTIVLADGLYLAKQQFTAITACTAVAPCALRGSRGAVLDGQGVGGHYGLRLQGASHWTLSGFTVANANQGIVLDASSQNVIDGVEVRAIGAEGIHLRSFSSDNVVRASAVHDTGKASPQYGEGVYVGSAVSNWGTYSGGLPDTSDRNVITGNSIWATGAESVDIKEGTTGGTLSRNRFDGAGMAGKNSADSWVDVKGNGWLVTGNTGAHALLDGFQTHVLAPGWGERNVFTADTADVGSSGYGFRFQNASSTRNVLGCDNVVTRAQLGLANQACKTS